MGCNRGHQTYSNVVKPGSEEEREILLTTGAELAAAGCNDRALEAFGMKWLVKNDWKGSLAIVTSLGLPKFTAPSEEEMAESDHLVSSLFPRKPETAQRRLALAFDRTYLQSCSQLCLTPRGHCLVGGPHRPPGFIDPDESQKVMKDNNGVVIEQIVSRSREKASEVESCCVWDPSRSHSSIYEVAAFPVMPAAERHALFEEHSTNPRLQRGQWATLQRLGQVLKACPSVKYIIADRHGSHNFLGSILLGRAVPLADELWDVLPFFNSLRFESLPKVAFNIPYRICFMKQESVHFFPGPAHGQKSFAEQMRSCLGTPHFGCLAADFAAALDLSLFTAAYVGKDAMSDRQAALLFPAGKNAHMKCCYFVAMMCCDDPFWSYVVMICYDDPAEKA